MAKTKLEDVNPAENSQQNITKRKAITNVNVKNAELFGGIFSINHREHMMVIFATIAEPRKNTRTMQSVVHTGNVIFAAAIGVVEHYLSLTVS